MAEVQTRRRSLTRIRRFINKLPGWSVLTLKREDGYLYCDPTQTHTNTLRVQVPVALSSGLQTEHSILFNHTNVSRPEAEAGCVWTCNVCKCVCACRTGIWSLAETTSLHLFLVKVCETRVISMLNQFKKLHFSGGFIISNLSASFRFFIKSVIFDEVANIII